MTTQFKKLPLDPKKVGEFLLNADENTDLTQVFLLTPENYSSSTDNVLDEELVSAILEILKVFTELAPEEKEEILSNLPDEGEHLCARCLLIRLLANPEQTIEIEVVVVGSGGKDLEELLVEILKRR